MSNLDDDDDGELNKSSGKLPDKVKLHYLYYFITFNT